MVLSMKVEVTVLVAVRVAADGVCNAYQYEFGGCVTMILNSVEL